jgi:VWFA-related protein
MAFFRSRRVFIRTVIGAAAAHVVLARRQPTFTTEVKVVNILATVRDKQGRIVRGLSKADFVLFEDGKPQELKYFSRESDLPLTIALLVDTSFSQGKVLTGEISASYRFLNQVLREREDKAVIVQFDQAVVIRPGLTSSHKDLEDTLSLLGTPTAQEAANGSGTLLYDAVRQTAIGAMRKQPGRRALVVLTDGMDEGSAITLPEAIESAQEAQTLIYSILFSDASYYGGLGGSSGRRVLERLSKETGGGLFEVSKKTSIEQIYSAIEEELRSEYSLGFVSNKPVTSSGFRSIRVAVKPKGLVVQATNRYYAET